MKTVLAQKTSLFEMRLMRPMTLQFQIHPERRLATICLESYRIDARALSGVYLRYAQLISVYDRYG